MASAADRNSYSWYSNVRMIAFAGVSFLLSSATIGSFFSWALNQLRQPRIAAQVCEIVHALSSRRVQNHKTLDERGLVIGPLAFLNGHVLLHARGTPRERNACTTSGIPPRAIKTSSSGLGCTSNSNRTRLGKGLDFGAWPSSYANRASYGCEFLSKRVPLSWRFSRLSTGSNTLFATDGASRRHRYRGIGAPISSLTPDVSRIGFGHGPFLVMQIP